MGQERIESFAPHIHLMGIKIISNCVIDAFEWVVRKPRCGGVCQMTYLSGNAYMKEAYTDGKNCNPIWS